MHCYFGKPLYLCNVLRIEAHCEILKRAEPSFLFPKVLGHPSSFLRNIVFYLHPVPHNGYTMLNLGESLLWHLAERGVVHTSRPGANCFKKL